MEVERVRAYQVQVQVQERWSWLRWFGALNWNAEVQSSLWGGWADWSITGYGEPETEPRSDMTFTSTFWRSLFICENFAGM
jgi:hypothetical protein